MNEHDLNLPDRETGTKGPRPSDISTPSSTTPDPTPSELAAHDTDRVLSTTASITTISRSGPLPSADELRHYGEIDASFPERIVALAEAEAMHRRSIENRAVDAEIDSNRDAGNWMRRGQWMAFWLAVFFLGAGVWLTLRGHPAVGGIALGTTVVSLAAVFVAGRVPSREIEESDDNA